MSFARRVLPPFVAVALVAGGVAWMVAGRGVAESVWSVATAVVAVDLVAVTAAPSVNLG